MEIQINEDNILNCSLYEKILSIQDEIKRIDLEDELFKKAKEFKVKTKVEKLYKKVKKEKQLENFRTNKLNFGEKAEIPVMLGGNYIISKEGSIFDCSGNEPKLVCSQLIQPVCIYENIEEDKQLIKCNFLKNGRWHSFVQDRLILSHNGKIVNLASRGVDVTTNNSAALVKYIISMVNLNKDIIPVKSSVSRMGWIKNGDDEIFIPYDENIAYDGDDSFKAAFESLHKQGDYSKWLEEMKSIRKNTVVRILHATSLASVLLTKLNKQSFVTMVWGTTGDGKTVAAMSAMSFWGNPAKGKLMLTLNSTNNHYFRTAAFFNNLPCFYDELQTYKGDMNNLIMNLTEGIDRGKAKADGGVETSKTWQNAFIMTGEQTASNFQSGGGTLNRLIEINSNGKIIQDGSHTSSVFFENYGFAGEIFVNYIRSISVEDLKELYSQKCKELLSISDTEEKQALNMAMILLADDLACECIFKNEQPLNAEEVSHFMFTKSEIDITQRAYEVFLDECEKNRNKFVFRNDSGRYEGSSMSGEFWGGMDEYEITIIKSQLDELLKKKGYSFKQIIKGWENKGYVQRNSSGKTATNTRIAGRKAYFVTVKVMNFEDFEDPSADLPW